MRALTVDFELIAQSMRDLARLSDDYFFDRSNGKIYGISRLLIRSLVEETRTERPTLPEWDEQLAPLAREIILTASTRYVRIPEAFGCPEHKWMADFARDVKSIKLKQKLVQSLKGRGSCQRFKQILHAIPNEQKGWELYRLKRWSEKVQQWLEGLGILAVNDNLTLKRSLAK